MSDFFSLPVHELVKQVKDAKLTSVEICQAYIDRIGKFEKDVKAWVHFDKKLLLERAEESDNYRKSGKPIGPLHGIPVALKDIIGTYDNAITLASRLAGFDEKAKIIYPDSKEEGLLGILLNSKEIKLPFSNLDIFPLPEYSLYYGGRKQ